MGEFVGVDATDPAMVAAASRANTTGEFDPYLSSGYEVTEVIDAWAPLVGNARESADSRNVSPQT